jgi:Tol biopolymer transport system component
VALLAGGFAGRTFFAQKGEDLSAYRFTAVATEQGLKSSPAWSPDGRTIAYAAQVNSVFQIFARGPDQPVPAQLTHSASDCGKPFWSPDNTRLFYISERSLWEIGAAGGEPEERLRGIGAAALSPDGKTLAFSRYESKGMSVWVQPIGGSQPRKLGSDVAAIQSYLRFTPDGASIGLWVSTGPGKLVFWRLSLPQGDAHRAFEALTNIRGPIVSSFTWFPDSRHVVFSGSSIKGDNDHLLLADTKTGSLRPITAGLDGEADPFLSADGARLAFTASKNDQDIVEIPLDGSPMRNMLATSTEEHCPTWSPKGDQFAYAKQHNGMDEIWIHNIGDGLERPLITAASFREGKTDRVSEPRYSPDGQRIAFSRVANGTYSIWVASVAGGPPAPLGVDNEMVPTWSPDGAWIAYTSVEVSGAGLFKIASGGGGKPVTIIPAGGGGPTVVRAQWSPRGDWIVWTGKRGLEVASPDGSRRELLSDETGWQQVQGFSKDGATVFAIRSNQARHLVVESFDIATKREKLVLDIGPQVGMHSFSLAPDGKSFLTTLSRQSGDIWILDGFRKP